MILFINGAFGIGKTSVARALRARIRRAAIYDPELAGIAMQRLGRAFGKEIEDFQDLRSWRAVTVAGIRLVRMIRPVVIVPMAFSNAGYLREIEAAVRHFDPDCHHFCLVAPLAVVEQRLRTRHLTARDAEWQHRRAAECCVAHAEAAFATHIAAAERPADAVAAEILRAAGVTPSFFSTGDRKKKL